MIGSGTLPVPEGRQESRGSDASSDRGWHKLQGGDCSFSSWALTAVGEEHHHCPIMVVFSKALELSGGKHALYQFLEELGCPSLLCFMFIRAVLITTPCKVGILTPV